MRRKPLEFAAGDHVFLRVTRTTSMGRVGGLPNLKEDWVGGLRDCFASSVGKPPSGVSHLVVEEVLFYPSHVLEAEDVHIREDLTMEVPPVALEDSRVEECQEKLVSFVKVIWDWRTSDSTWELEEDMRESQPHMFSKFLFSRSKFFVVGGNVKPTYIF